MTETSSNKIQKKRIWELDFARGVAIWIVVFVHAYADLKFFSSLDIEFPGWFEILKQNGGVFFVILSGVSAYFSTKSVKRGSIVFLIGCCFTALTEWLYRSGIQEEPIFIRWGVLHLIGFCMIVYPLFKDAKPLTLSLLAAVIIPVGIYIHQYRYDVSFLFMFGIRNPEWSAFDYFPILPNLGWFMLGNALAKIIYKGRGSGKADISSLFPGVNTENPVIRFFMYSGRKSLQIYVVHQLLFYIIARQI